MNERVSVKMHENLLVKVFRAVIAEGMAPTFCNCSTTPDETGEKCTFGVAIPGRVSDGPRDKVVIFR